MPPKPAQPPHGERDTSCPRCGYDQAGVIDTWLERCPMRGTCPECGLEFRWRDLLDPVQRTPPWYVERARQFLLPCLLTLVRVMYPPLLWRHVPLGAPYRPRRLAAALLVTPLLMYLVLYIAVAVCEYRRYQSWGSSLLFRPSMTGTELNAAALAKVVAYPFCALPQYTRRYDQSTGYDWQFTTLMHFTFLLPILMPVAFTLLPFSLRHFRLRPRHLVRIATLSLCGCLMLLAVNYALPGFLGTVRDFHAHPVVDVVRQGPMTMVWSIWFWAIAIKWYLRMPHAWAVSIALHVISGMLILLSPALLLTIGSYA